MSGSLAYASDQLPQDPDWLSSGYNGREYITVEGVGRMKEAFKGMGILYCSMQGNSSQEILNCQFDLQQITPAKYTNDEAGKISLELEAQPRSPCSCSGIRTSTG